MLRYWHRMTDRERRRWLMAESHNLITTNGLTAINAFYTSTGSGIQGFSQQFSVGTTAINGVAPGDNSVVGEVYRAAPTSSSTVGNVLSIVTYFGPYAGGHSGTNPVVYTNAGLYGGGATSTLGSGTLNTHAPYSFTKPYGLSINNTYTIDRS